MPNIKTDMVHLGAAVRVSVDGHFWGYINYASAGDHWYHDSNIIEQLPYTAKRPLLSRTHCTAQDAIEALESALAG